MKETPKISISKTDSLKIQINELSANLNRSLENQSKYSTELEIKVDNLNSQLNKLNEKSNLSLWSPIIAALITAIISTLLAQAIDRGIKNRRENKKDVREIHSKAVNAKIKLKDLFRQLAMHKFHAQYWWHIHSQESDNEFRNKYYLEHLRSQSEARITEKEIGEEKANFLSEIVKFERLKGSGFNVDKEKADIENLVFKKAKTYDSTISADDLREKLAEKDEKSLRDEYFENLKIFQAIIDKMK